MFLSVEHGELDRNYAPSICVIVVQHVRALSSTKKSDCICFQTIATL